MNASNGNHGYSIVSSPMEDEIVLDNPPPLQQTPDQIRFWEEVIMPFKEAGDGDGRFPE